MVHYGPHAAALAVYLGVGHHLPVKRAAGVLARLAGARVSSGWLAAQRARAARLLEARFLPHVRALLRQVGVLHVDETPGRVAGELRYVHVACTEFLTAMHVGDRSAATIDAGGVLAEFGGVLVRDGYAGYTHLTRAVHAWCGGAPDPRPARRLRRRTRPSTVGRRDGRHPARRPRRRPRRRPLGHRPRPAGSGVHNHYRGAARKGIGENENRRSRLGRDALRLARRFTERETTILRFATDLATPFTNNEAERTVRPVKVQQRASGGAWRTLDGLADFAIVASYLSTAPKWGKDSLDVLQQLFTTGPWLPATAAPT